MSSFHSDQNDIFHIEAQSLEDFSYNLGLLHALHRRDQLTFIQQALRSELSQQYREKSDEELDAFRCDVFMAKQGFYYQAQKEKNEFENDPSLQFLKTYSEGINKGRRQFRSLFNQDHLEPWSVVDSLALYKAMTFLTTATGQLSMEKFIAKGLAKGISPLYFEKLVGNLTHQNDQSLADIIPFLQKANLFENLFERNAFIKRFPRFEKTNGWALQGERTENAYPLMAFSPQSIQSSLESPFFECVWNKHPDFQSGITLVGLPLFLMGRNQNMSFCFSPGSADQIDYFIEEVSNGFVIGHDGPEAINTREVTLFRGKKRKPQSITIYETQRGLLEDSFPSGLKSEGYYLCQAFSIKNYSSCASLKAHLQISQAKNCEEVRIPLQSIPLSANWLFSDREGHISLERRGIIAKRQGTGLIPLLAWNKEHQFSGLKQERLTLENPKEKHLILSNIFFKDLESVNLPAPKYACQRTHDHFQSKERINLLECQNLQCDLYSYQAKRYLDLIRAWIPDTPTGRILSNWDLTYGAQSKGAYLFEQFLKLCYQNLIEPIFGYQQWQDFTKNSDIIHYYYHLIDQVIFDDTQESDFWFNEVIKADKNTLSPRDQFLKENLDQTLSHFPSAKLKPWAKINNFVLKTPFRPRIFFKERKRKYDFLGSRASVSQAERFDKKNILTNSYRYITPLDSKTAYSSSIAEFNRFFNFQYKTVIPY
ncbi:MAG: penicillin acylase family protein [Bdellovibrionota bacterium]|nr:penicillin acylase family protein [Bdellovibrionota bacterium]